MRKRAGFTLIELLIVMAVIAALMATLTPVAVGAVQKAKATQVAMNLRAISQAAQQYIYVNQEVPSGLTVASLTELGYLDKTPEGTYTIDITGPSNGKITVKAIYDNSDNNVDNDLVVKVDPNIKIDGNNITYTSTAVVFW